MHRGTSFWKKALITHQISLVFRRSASPKIPFGEKIFYLFFRIIFICPLLSASSSFCEEIQVEVLRVVDGDTIDVLYGEHVKRVRLKGIDSPEWDQPFGKQATAHLSSLIQDREVSIFYESYDSYGRLLGKIFVDGYDINLRMIKDGFAWWYRYYRDQLSLEDQVLYESAETYSKTLKLGLWQSENPINPYEWRKLKKTF